jgi:hypothetical protein
MLPGRFGGAVGRTRVCPHCKATILESAPICPQCRHHLRFVGANAPAAPEGFSALSVEGTVQHPERGGDWEYSVVLAIRDERGQEISRQVVGVGALRAAQSRTFALSVEVLTPGAKVK